MRRFTRLLSTLVLAFSSTVLVAEDHANGEKVYDLWCGICHEGGPQDGYGGSQVLALTRGESQARIKDNDTLSPTYIEAVVRKGLGMMPPFRKTEISDDELNDLIAYLLSDQ